MKNIVITLLSLLCFLVTEPSHARSDNWQEIAKEKAQKAIDACWAISEEDRNTGSTILHRKGHLDTALCMEEHIVEISEKYFFKNDPEKVQRVRDDLEKFRFGYGHFHWMLYNEIDQCFENERPGCGTMYHVFHNNKYARALEPVVHNVYRQLKHYSVITE